MTAFEKGKDRQDDKYFKVFDQMHYNLGQVHQDKSKKILSIERQSPTGLMVSLAADVKWLVENWRVEWN